MKTTNIFSFHQKGKREYQEDNLVFAPKLLLVSDGVGGLAKGEVASRIVKETIYDLANKSDYVINDVGVWVQNAIDVVVENLNTYAREHPESWKMGATLAMILQVKTGFYSVHIGDSRIYHFGENGGVKWVSKDHSLVQELIDVGMITEEQATTHPRRNVITRVIQAKENVKSPKAAIHKLENVEPNDIFMVCSDGVMEAWSDDALNVLMGSDLDYGKKCEELKHHCTQESRDNNTAILAVVEGCVDQGDVLVETKQGLQKAKTESLYIDEVKDVSKSTLVQNERSISGKENKMLPSSEDRRQSLFFPILFIIALGLLSWYFFFSNQSKSEKVENVDALPTKKSSAKSTKSIKNKTTNKQKKTTQSSSSKEDSQWIETQKNNTLDSFENFQPTGTHSRNPKKRSEELLWVQTVANDLLSGYESYLKKYPDGLYVKDAKLRIETRKKIEKKLPSLSIKYIDVDNRITKDTENVQNEDDGIIVEEDE